jgi:hypothetical protein
MVGMCGSGALFIVVKTKSVDLGGEFVFPFSFAGFCFSTFAPLHKPLQTSSTSLSAPPWFVVLCSLFFGVSPLLPV